MKIKLEKIIFVTILFMILVSISASATETDFYIIDVSPTEVTPGETTKLSLTLKNLGTTFASRIEVSLDPEDTSPIDPIGIGSLQIGEAKEAQTTTYFGVVNQLEEIKLSFNFNVDTGTEEKTYNVPLVLTWSAGDSTEKSQTLPISMQVKELKADFQVVQSSPEMLIGGGTSTLKIILKNFGDNYANDLKAEIDSNDVSPIDPIGQIRLVFEDQKIQPDENILLEYPINVKQGTPESVYYTPIVLEWDDDTSVSKNQTVKIGNLVKEPHTSLEVSYEAPDIITPGDEFNLGVTLKNTGDSVYHIDTIVGGERESLLSRGPDNNHIEELSTGETNRIEINFISNKDLDTGLYSIPITLKYEGLDGQPKAQTENVPVEVKGFAKLNIASLKIEPQIPKKGEEITIELRIENIGDDDAENTKLVLDSELKGFKTAYLGELEKNDDTPAIFTLRANAAGEVTNKLILTYEDDFGEHVLSEEIRFNISNNQTQDMGGLLVVLLAAAAFIIFVVAKKRKR
jgi:hypothetical protein